MLAHQGTIFRLKAHLDRLEAGAQILRIKPPLSRQELREAVQTTVNQSQLQSAYVRLTLTRGVGGRPSQLEAGSPSTMIWVRELDGYPQQLYERGMSAILATTRRNEHSVLSRIKSLNYLDNLLARAEAQQAGADEAIMLNTAGMIAEASASNLFIVMDGRLLTPPVEAGLLPGITRACVMQLAHTHDIDLTQQLLSLNELSQAQEAFLTNSLMGVMPLTRFQDRPIGSGQVGDLTRMIAEAYHQLFITETCAETGEDIYQCCLPQIICYDNGIQGGMPL